MVVPRIIHLQAVDGRRDVFSKDQLHENLVEREVDDSGVEHSLGDKLADDSEQVYSLPA